MYRLVKIIFYFPVLLLLICGCNKNQKFAEITHDKPREALTSIVFGSCISRYKPGIWKSIALNKPDYILLLGDNIYAEAGEYTDINNLKKLYQANFGSPDVISILNNSKTYAIWDDHDFGDNNSDSTFQYRHNSLETNFSFKS